MSLVKQVPEAVGAVGAVVVERVGRDRQLELVVLPEIAHLQRTEYLDVLLVALRLQFQQALPHQALDDLAGPRGLEAFAGELRRAMPINARIRHDEAEGRELAGVV